MTEVPFLEDIVYNGYHDGKRHADRKVRIAVDDIVQRADLPRKYRNIWRKALKEDLRLAFDATINYILGGTVSTNQFWDWNCDVFVFGHIVGDAETATDRMMFAMRPAGWGWYCVNYNYSIIPRVGKSKAREVRSET